MSRSIQAIFDEANASYDAKDWAACRTSLEELFHVGHRPAIAAATLGEVCFNDGDLAAAIQWDLVSIKLDASLRAPLEHLIFLKDAQPDTTAADAMNLRQLWWARFGRMRYAARRPLHPDRNPNRPLRVGYVSNDFRWHSACCAFGTIVTGHSSQIEPYFYSTWDRQKKKSEPFDLTALWAQEYTSSWRDVHGWTDHSLIKQIRQDRIDILVDLSGFTEGGKLTVFAARPAPIQIQAWGYALGTGGPAIDVLFTDPIVATPEIRAELHERAVDLPALLSYFPRPDLSEASPLPCLNEPPMFAVFNRGVKTNEDTLSVWAQILDRVPGSRIWFQGFDYSERRQQAIAARLGESRVLFRSEPNDLLHKQCYQQVDLSLDPWPQTGGVSSLDALWMGVPMVTLLGPRMIQRTSASFLTLLGLEAFIAETPEQYVNTAVEWVTTRRDDLATIRAGLRNSFRCSPILSGYVQAVESAYRELWVEYCEKGTITKLH